jgi:DinB superfamily
MSDIPALLERYRRGAELLAMVLTGVFGEEEDFVTAPGKWSIRTIVAHCADAELVGAARFRQVIAEDDPAINAYDQDAWAVKLDYAQRKPKQSLETFRRLRAETYDLLKGLPAETFERTCRHSVNGAMTLHQMLDGYAGHAESHAKQLQGIREAYKAAKGKK